MDLLHKLNQNMLVIWLTLEGAHSTTFAMLWKCLSDLYLCNEIKEFLKVMCILLISCRILWNVFSYSGNFPYGKVPAYLILWGLFSLNLSGWENDWAIQSHWKIILRWKTISEVGNNSFIIWHAGGYLSNSTNILLSCID